MAKTNQEIMEILEAFDLTRSYRAAAQLTGTDHKTVLTEAGSQYAEPLLQRCRRRTEPRLPRIEAVELATIGNDFRKAVKTFARRHGIPMFQFNKRTPGVVAIGVAQEFQSVMVGHDHAAQPGAVCFGFRKADRRVTVYYFYLWDAEFGPGFIKLCSYFPYPAKVWLNGHEWAKRQASA